MPDTPTNTALAEDGFPFDYMDFKNFRKRYPDAHSSDDSLRWETRFRSQNGMLTTGAVVERYADPQASRPSLLYSPSRYFQLYLRRKYVA